MKQKDLLDVYRNSILKLMRIQNIHISQLAREVNVPQPTLYRLLKGKTNDIKLSTLIEIADFFSVDLADLSNHGFHTKERRNTSECRNIPVLNWKEVGCSSLDNNEEREYLCPGIKCSEKTFALRAKASFEQTFSKDTILIVDPRVEAIDGDYVIINYKNSSEATIRKLIVDGPIGELKKITCSEIESITNEINIIGPIMQSIVLHRRNATQ